VITELTENPAHPAHTPTPPATLIGQQVRVRCVQPRRLGPPKFPGREGRVIRENSIPGGGPLEDRLWYVQLVATKRARARVETFWGRDLDLLDAASPTVREGEAQNA